MPGSLALAGLPVTYAVMWAISASSEYFSRAPDSGKLRAPSLAPDWQIKRLIEVEARVSYHARRWYVHVASAFSLAHHYRAVLAWGPLAPSQ